MKYASGKTPLQLQIFFGETMNKILFIAIFVFTASLAGPGTPFGADGETNGQYAPGEVLVRFHEWVDDSEIESLRKNLEAVRVSRVKSIRLEEWSLPEEFCVEDAVDILERSGKVKYAEPNYLYRPRSLPEGAHFENLWHLENTGQTVNSLSGRAGSDISARQAWEIEKGDPGIVIAVIDSGIAYDHPDLEGNIWRNVHEIPGTGRDDDNNGYVDDVHGWDFVNENNTPLDYSKDLHSDGHGTHVAGIIAADGSNSTGMAGVMWNAQIMPLQVFDLFEINTFAAAVIKQMRILRAIEYAVNNGARIINCSFGGYSRSQGMYDLIDHADQNGVLVVAAAGNDGRDNDSTPVFPASYDLPNIISVAATNEKDELAAYSNYGATTVDVAAPGGSASAPNLFSTGPPERAVLFYDDFGSGGDKWLTSSNHEDWSIFYDTRSRSHVLRSSAGLYANNENAYAVTADTIDATDCRGLHLQFDISYFLEPGYDYLYVETSRDGRNFVKSYHATGYASFFTFRDWGIELDFDTFFLRFRLQTDETIVDEGVYIDNVIVTGVPWHYKGDEYCFKSGTSMAAPVVAGVAGLILSHNPSLSPREVKSIILDTADPLPSLSGRVASGGRVNAHSALLAAGGAPGNETGDREDPDQETGSESGGCFIEAFIEAL